MRVYINKRVGLRLKPVCLQAWKMNEEVPANVWPVK